MKTLRNVIILISVFLFPGCDELLDVEPKRSMVDKNKVFDSDATATSAVTGIYAGMYSNTTAFASGSVASVASLASMSGGDIRCYAIAPDLLQFNDYQILETNPHVLSLWRTMFSAIYSANSAIKGIETSTGLSTPVRSQLLGEAYFIRAFSHFYLVNLFGEVPIVTTIDFEQNAIRPKSPVADVYEQILTDLQQSLEFISEDYVTSGRVRPNQGTINAFLARVYLYTGKWQLAIEAASKVIENDKYSMSALGDVFAAGSAEAIWQLMPEGLTVNTNEGNVFVLGSAPIYSSQPFALSPELIGAFFQNDMRFSEWVGQFDAEGTIYYFPYKYKVPYGGSLSIPQVDLTEYSMVLRLAEQFLIRSEARLHLGESEGAIEDLNVVKARAGVEILSQGDPLLTTDSLYLAVERERQLEFFAEWGHRWLDLKRTGRTNQALNGRPGWAEFAELYPLPQSEREKNPSLGLQNAGY